MRLLKLKVITVVGETLDFGTLPVIADADDGRLGIFDDLDKSLHASSVTHANSIAFVHDVYLLL